MVGAGRAARGTHRVTPQDVTSPLEPLDDFPTCAAAAPRAFFPLAAAAVLGLACASQGMPPGGPDDTAPPALVRVLPESASVRTSPPSVQFLFNEVVSERPRGAASLEQLVVISPSDGPPSVAWERNRLVVRPRRGWRPNTAYTVTVLAGLSDLRGNASPRPFRTVFSTGAEIPAGTIRGVAFDWMAGRAVGGARIEATADADTLLKWAIAADSLGRYTLGSLPAGTLLVRTWIDQNNNGIRDSREAADSALLSVIDSVRHDFYAIVRDTLGARLTDVSVTDSVTVTLKFDRGLPPAAPLEGASIRLLRARDSSEIRLASVLTRAAHDSAAFLRRGAVDDSVARTDTTEAGRRRRAAADSTRRAFVSDSIARKQIADARSARDTTRREPPPVFGRLIPPVEFVIMTAEPIPEDVQLRLVAADVQGIAGRRRSSDRLIVRRKATPRDSTATKRPPGTYR